VARAPRFARWFFFAQAIADGWGKLSSSSKQRTPQQEMAEHIACGEGGFGKYGPFNVIHALATTYHVTPLQAEGISLAYAILSFRYQSDTASYSEELMRITSSKK
jgi:hypothetical protein